MNNNDIRMMARNQDVRLWQIADKLNMQDSNFSKMLRKELPNEKKEHIYKIINEIAKERECNTTKY
jgi:predicted DNA-binding ribbon-helix-helix protein